LKPLREREQLTLFRALPVPDMAPRDAQDLMAYPFFSLAKSRRTVPIHFESGPVRISVEGAPEHGIATIWDADVLIWAASHIVQARDQGLRTSRLMAATPHEILTFIQRGTGSKDYRMLKSSLDRLQSTTVATSIRQSEGRRLHRFSWINEWKELPDKRGQSYGIELILADWFYTGVVDNALVLTLDPGYFRLTGGFERWLYRLVRKHGGRQWHGWRFDLRHLHLKSGTLQRYSDFVLHLRRLVNRQALPGYRLAIARVGHTDWLHFRCRSDVSALGATADDATADDVTFNLSTAAGEKPVDSVWTASGINRTAFGESPANDSGNRPHASTCDPRPATLCAVANVSNLKTNHG
jgi:plasmid replication initiation protein